MYDKLLTRMHTQAQNGIDERMRQQRRTIRTSLVTFRSIGEIYTFVADNYAPFYSTPIECTDRDAAFVLDGLLYNESDLELDEHYTDTHGYTENQLRCLRDARSAILPAHPGRAPPAHLPNRSQPRLRRSQKPGRASRPHHRPEPHRRAVGPHGTVLRVAAKRPCHRLGRAAAAGRLQWQKPLLSGQSRSRAASSRPSSCPSTCRNRSCAAASGAGC